MQLKYGDDTFEFKKLIQASAYLFVQMVRNRKTVRILEYISSIYDNFTLTVSLSDSF